MKRFFTTILLLGMLALAACNLSGTPTVTTVRDGNAPLRVVTTTNILGDVIQNIGQEDIELHILIPPGVDEHSFQVTPEDVAQVADADLIFVNGAGLEQFLEPLLENSGNRDRIIAVSDGIELLQAPTSTGHSEVSGSNGADPHVWTDPTNVKIWADNIATSLAKYDPPNADSYKRRAKDYQSQLDELDQWIKNQVSTLPAQNRQLVSDHIVLNYFARRYGFNLVGAIIPAFSTLAEPTAQDIAQLEDAIHQLGVKTIFVGNTINPSLAERIAQDTGTRILSIYTGSLGDAGGPASTYIDYMKYNTDAIVEGLQ